MRILVTGGAGFIGAAEHTEGLGAPDVIDAVAGHAEFLEVPRETRMAKTLFAVDELSGLVTETAWSTARRCAVTGRSCWRRVASGSRIWTLTRSRFGLCQNQDKNKLILLYANYLEALLAVHSTGRFAALSCSRTSA